MRWKTVIISFLLLISYINFVGSGNQNHIYLEVHGTKTLVLPFGTKILGIHVKGNATIIKSCGIKNGQHSLFINIHSDKGAEVEIKYATPSSSLPSTYDFLIISPDKWKDVLEPLAKHKEKHGISTVIVGLNEIYGGKYFTVQGRDEAEKIKYFIKDAIEKWGIKYVLLVGGRKPGLHEEWLMPVRYSYLNDRSSSWEYERRFISDLYYADIYDGNGKFSSWDSNENNYFGEYDHELNGKKVKDKVDLVPDVYIGRLPARSKMELERVINNIIKYEENPDASFNNVILCGGDLYLHDPWDVAEGEKLLDAVAGRMNNYNIIKIYASQGLDWRKINDAINGGAGFVFFEGAGNHHLWATHAKDDEKWIFYYERNILQLKNAYLPIVMTSGARLGQFNKTRECFNWFFVSKGKAVASIGSTGLCWIGHGDNITTMFLGNLHVRVAEKMAQGGLIGDAWGESITEYLCNFSWEGVAEAFHMKAAEELEIFGDPTLKIGGYGKIEAKEKNGNVLNVGNGENYTHIQDAIDDAENGDIILVHEGIYHENLSIDKSVEIIGEGAKIKTDGIKIYADDVLMENFSIEGYGRGKGIICYGDSASIIENEICHFNTSIFVYGKHFLMEENVMRNSICGVWLNESSDANIINNTFCNNWYGVWGEKAENVSISYNNFSYNHWYAIWMEGKRGSIDNNYFIHNWYSVYFYNSIHFSLEKNVIKINIHGPQFVNSSFNMVEKNVFQHNEHYGIYFGWRSNGNSITRNDFIENAQNARDDGKNTWNENYWSNYIGVKMRIFYFLHFPCYIPSFSFDWHPMLTPQNIY